MVDITNTNQLSTFSIVRDIIRSNTTLGAKFSQSSFYEFEPRHKSASFKGFPYIVISIPDLEELDPFLGDTMRSREFNIELLLRMDYTAKDNVASYASTLISTLDAANSTFKENGYNLIKINSDGSPTPVDLDSKLLIEGRFSLILSGEVKV